jgi:hypothetical protein
MSKWVSVLALGLALAGCHAKFKKAAPTLGAVRPQLVSVAAGPSVALGSSGSAVLDVVNGIRSLDVAEKLARGVRLEQVNDAFQASLSDTLGDGPPFGLTGDKKAPTLQIEVVNYGLSIPQMGGPAAFVYDVRVRIYREDGERVYSSSLSCGTGVDGANTISQVLDTRDNMGNVLEMRKKEIQAAFDAAGEACGRDLVLLMRKHAS